MKLDCAILVVLAAAMALLRTVQARIIVTVDTDSHGSLAIGANGHNFTLTGQNSDHLITVYTYLDMLLSPKEGSTPEEPVHKAAATGHDSDTKHHQDSANGQDSEDQSDSDSEEDDFVFGTHYQKSNHHRYSGGKFRPSRRRRRH